MITVPLVLKLLIADVSGIDLHRYLVLYVLYEINNKNTSINTDVRIGTYAYICVTRSKTMTQDSKCFVNTIFGR